MIKKTLIVTIVWVLFIPCLWFFIEGTSYIATYVAYSIIDKINPTEMNLRMLPRLRHISNHPLFFPDGIKNSVYDSFLTWRLTPNANYTSGLEVNSYGFIHNGDVKRPPFANNKAIKVVLLGGSSVAGIGAADNRETIASYLERQLNDNDLNIEYEVINSGHSGYYTPIELTYFVMELVHYKPDVVVALDGWNDFWYSFSLIRESAGYEGWAIPQRTTHHRSIENFINNPTFFAAINYAGFKRVFYYTVGLLNEAKRKIDEYLTKEKKLVKPPQGKSVWVNNAIYIRDEINKTYSHIPFMEKNWRSLIGAARANKVKPILLLQPAIPVTEKKLTNGETDGYNELLGDRSIPVEQYDKEIRNFYDEARKMVKRLKVSFPNSEEVIIEDISKMFTDESRAVFLDVIHSNRYGNCKIAELIASKIRNNSNEIIDSRCQ